MRLGKKEKEMLIEIELSAGDMLLGFLCSGGSSSIMYRTAHRSAKMRQEKGKQAIRERQIRTRRVRQLEKKRLIQMIPHGDDFTVALTARGRAWAGVSTLIHRSKTKTHPQWDGKWTLVMFDMPTGCTSERVSFVSLLKQIGFVQVQMSNYVFPYEVPALENFLQTNPNLGEFCHVFRGLYYGDDTHLCKKFKIKKHS